MKILIFSFISMLVILGSVYGSLKYLRAQKEEALNNLSEKDSTIQVTPLSKEDSLKLMMDDYQTRLIGQKSDLDSLQQLVEEKDKLVKQQKKQVKNLSQQKESDEIKSGNAKAMAKTFEKMSVKQIAPILKNLDDETVVLIYKETGNRFKKNILLAVNEKRAAMITNVLINRN